MDDLKKLKLNFYNVKIRAWIDTDSEGMPNQDKIFKCNFF